MVTTEKILQTMNSLERGELIVKCWKICLRASSHSSEYLLGWTVLKIMSLYNFTISISIHTPSDHLIRWRVSTSKQSPYSSTPSYLISCFCIKQNNCSIQIGTQCCPSPDLITLVWISEWRSQILTFVRVQSGANNEACQTQVLLLTPSCPSWCNGV